MEKGLPTSGIVRTHEYKISGSLFGTFEVVVAIVGPDISATGGPTDSLAHAINTICIIAVTDDVVVVSILTIFSHRQLSWIHSDYNHWQSRSLSGNAWRTSKLSVIVKHRLLPPCS
eukprot:scaffold630937_cov37-Prasinocladus_malaysianus.AAC.1